MSVQFIPLEQACDFLSGYAWSAANFQSDPVGMPIIRIQNVDSVRESDFVYWDGPFDDRFVVRNGDLLLTLSGSFRVVVWEGPDALLNQRIVKLIPKKGFTRDWLLYVLRNGLEAISGMGRHALVSNVALADLRLLKIPFQTVEEQRRIAAILDQAETLRTQRRTALALLDSLTQSLFLDMFGDPVVNDRGWPKVAVNDFVAGFESGKSLVADDEEDSASKYRVLKVSAVTSLEYKPEQSKALPTDYAPPQSHIVRAGDLLFSRANTSELIGATAYVEETPDNLLLPDKLWRFVWHAPSKAAPLYVMHLFRQPKFRQEIGQRASGTSGSMKNISQEKVLSIQVGNPPLPLQQTFATRIASIEALRTTHHRALTALDALFASLQQRAFSGELTPAAPRSPAQSLEQLQQLEASIGLEALIFIAKRMPDGDLYNSLKAIYFADRHHLEHYGHQIYNETYCALPHGPVPQSAYDATRVLIGERMFSDFDDDAMRVALRRNDKKLTALRDADFSKLSRSVVESLEWAIRYCSDMKFGQTKTASHDSAYERTPKNEAIPLQYIIDTLPPEARQRHWNL